METRWIFPPSKLHRKKYVETTWIFPPSKLHRQKYVETTWIFRSVKLHQKSTWKRRGNSSKFGLRRIDIISTSNRCRFDVVCPLGLMDLFRFYLKLKLILFLFNIFLALLRKIYSILSLNPNYWQQTFFSILSNANMICGIPQYSNGDSVNGS